MPSWFARARSWAGVPRDSGRVWVGNAWNARKSLPDWFANLMERPYFWTSYLNIGRMYGLDGDTIATLCSARILIFLLTFFYDLVESVDDVIYTSIPLKRFNGKILLIVTH